MRLASITLFLSACSTQIQVASLPDASHPPLDLAPACSLANCAAPGHRCRGDQCVEDCRPADAIPCAASSDAGPDLCDFTDGKCRPAASACLLAAPFADCGRQSCGPGTTCDNGNCVPWTAGCTGVDCDSTGRCWGTNCPCARPAPVCTPPSLADLNRAEFAGSLKNNSDAEGAFDLGFDEICNAYAVTMISGPDYLRQMSPQGTITEWASTTNLNMGQVAVLRLVVGEFATIGDIAATYICCANCGCLITGQDGRLGVIHLDRASMMRPLPNVIPAMSTDGKGPFGNTSIDTGPYGLTWGGDGALYVGNVAKNGDFARLDLKTLKQTPVAMFPARVVAADVFDLSSLLVALEGGQIVRLETATGKSTPFATAGADVTSLHRDRFTGRVYAELRKSPPQIVEIAADGTTIQPFQTAPRLGRIALAPDGYLYHLSVFPAVQWKSKSAIVRWPLPAAR